jgi:uncharacterized membrane protein YbhN (UPF0104 family)
VTRHRRFLISLLVAGAALYYCFRKVDWQAFWLALSGASLVPYLAFVAVFCLAMLAGDAWAISDVYRRTIGATRLRDVLLLRGVSYLPSIVNYHLGQALFTWFLSRTHQAPVWKVAGSTLLCYATTFGGLVAFCGLSFVLAPDRFSWLLPLLVGLVLGAVAYFVVLARGRRWLERFPATRVLCDAGVTGHFRALATRLPHVAVMFFGTWVPFYFFEVDIPFSDALGLVPVLLLVGVLPLTPQGIGTREVVAIELLSPYAAGTDQEAAARITACSLSWVVLLTLGEAALSLVTAPGAHQLAPPESASAEALEVES